MGEQGLGSRVVHHTSQAGHVAPRWIGGQQRGGDDPHQQTGQQRLHEVQGGKVDEHHPVTGHQVGAPDQLGGDPLGPQQELVEVPLHHRVSVVIEEAKDRRLAVAHGMVHRAMDERG